MAADFASRSSVKLLLRTQYQLLVENSLWLESPDSI